MGAISLDPREGKMMTMRNSVMRNEKRNGMLTREMRKIRLALESKEDNEGEKATMAKGEDKLNKKQEMPVKLLQEAEGHVVTMELKNGDVYCGNLVESEDNWNCQLESVTATTKVLLNCISLLIFLIPAFLCHV
jgi:small nuclear ribonucleoprotein (snRNP)-like protein